MATQDVHRMRAAKLKPGVSLDSIPTTDSTPPGTSAAQHTIRGKALIFWDPRRPGKKLDAIDTDQITPAKDCVSESLDASGQELEGRRLSVPHAGFPGARAPG